MCWKVLPCFIATSAWIYIVLTAMKQGDKALNTSLLQFLSSVKRFIATIFFSALIASLPLLFMKKII
jgi:hypothetical protein